MSMCAMCNCPTGALVIPFICLHSMEMSRSSAELLDNTQAFLAKRDGIDKTLKILRYSTRFFLATALRGQESELTNRLDAFQNSIGTSRKAYRLGKFLQNVNAIRKRPITTPHAKLEWLANGGEAVYYFTEQFQW
jgi:hypothetical protein